MPASAPGASTGGELVLRNAKQTGAFGARVADWLEPGWVIYLLGELGAGKTTLVRGALRRLGYAGPVRSPTFTLVEPYPLASGRHCHMDLYRLVDPREVSYLGGDDYFTGDWVCWIEWPERGAGVLPGPDLVLRISYQGRGRKLYWEASSPRAQTRCLGGDDGLCG